jgi:formylglycine-generating enzyme required for sulfatase activity
MADTRQVVSWSLERKCPFRSGDQWFLPNETYRQLADLRIVAEAIPEKRVVDGICVTGWTCERDNAGKSHEIPCSGFRVEDRLGKYGGFPAAISTCGGCEANAQSKTGISVAGCYGALDVWPDSQELDDQLWKIIEEHGWEDRLRSAFQVTTPLWYGFWIESPLRRLQAEFLYDLLNLACDHDDPQDRDIVHFLNALKAAVSWELPVHVSLVPLGHTDFGWYTIFPHCPRCKANAPVGRWQEKYTTEPHECRVCGHTFNPNEHHSSERDDYDWDATSLEKNLRDGYEAFVKTFLLHRGCTETQAEEIIDNKNNGPLLRRIAGVRKKREASMRTLRKERAAHSDDQPSPTITFCLSDDIDLELVLVPAGEFLMGSSETDQQNEAPQHKVCIPHPFYIGRFPITQAQWKALMGKNRSRHKDDPDLPVDQVSWLDCQEFCEVLSSRQRRVFRLPSEAEWEYACRAGTKTKFAFGDTLAPEQANFTPYTSQFGPLPTDEDALVREMEVQAESAETTGRERRAKPTPVGSYPPNAWGIYDMHGNVDEWCEDVWHPNYEGAPVDGSAWLAGEDREPFRVVRGGWCSATEFVCTSSSRRQLRADAGSHEPDDPEEEGENIPLDAIFEMMYTPYGFRVVCELP